MLDDFREWLSDNLRYFMLGGAILLVVLVLFFGIRACAGCGKAKDGDDQQQTTQQEQQEEPTGEAQEEEPEITNPLVEAEAGIKELVTNYYKALGDKDIEALQALLTELSPEDEAKITNAASYIEGYEMGDVYTKSGLEEKTYVVYACYSYLCSGIETAVPAMSQVYVVEDEEGKLLIDGSGENDTEITKYMDTLLKDADVVELVSKVQKAYDDAQKADPALAEFLSGLGSAESNGSSDASEGTILTVTEGCNVRAEASSDGDIIGGYDEGVQVEKLGTEGEWIKIEYEGQTGYIHSSLLE